MTGESVVVSPAPRTDGPSVLEGVGDFERVDGARVSYYLVDATSGVARPTMLLEPTYGTWTQVSASPVLRRGVPELSASARALPAPFTCADPCEAPLAP